MLNALFTLIQKFFSEMNMADSLTRFVTWLSGGILIVAFISCLFGYKLFRFVSGMIAFFLTAVGISLLLGPTANRAVVVTAFIIFGLLAAFLAYQWTEFGAFILCASIGFGLATLVTDIIWLHLLSALILGAISIRFPIICTIISTAIWGAVTIGTDGSDFAGIDQILFRILIIIGFGLLGIGIQYAMNKESIHDELNFLKKKPGEKSPTVINDPGKGGSS